MDQPTSPDRSADSDFSFLMAVLVAALLAVHTLYRAEAGQTTGFYPLRCGETALTLGSSGFSGQLRVLSHPGPQGPKRDRPRQRRRALRRPVGGDGGGTPFDCRLYPV